MDRLNLNLVWLSWMLSSDSRCLGWYCLLSITMFHDSFCTTIWLVGRRWAMYCQGNLWTHISLRALISSVILNDNRNIIITHHHHHHQQQQQNIYSIIQRCISAWFNTDTVNTYSWLTTRTNMQQLLEMNCILTITADVQGETSFF